MKMHKKGVLENLSALAKGAIVAMITIVVVLLIASNLASNASVTADGNASLATNTFTTAIATIPTWVGLIVLVAIAALIMFMVNRMR